MARKRSAAVFERRTLTISVTPIVETVADDDCGKVTCGYCSGGCSNCTTTCKGAASTKHLQVIDPLEEVELDVDQVLKAVKQQLEAVAQPG